MTLQMLASLPGRRVDICGWAALLLPTSVPLLRQGGGIFIRCLICNSSPLHSFAQQIVFRARNACQTENIWRWAGLARGKRTRGGSMVARATNWLAINRNSCALAEPLPRAPWRTLALLWGGPSRTRRRTTEIPLLLAVSAWREQGGQQTAGVAARGLATAAAVLMPITSATLWRTYLYILTLELSGGRGRVPPAAAPHCCHLFCNTICTLDRADMSLYFSCAYLRLLSQGFCVREPAERTLGLSTRWRDIRSASPGLYCARTGNGDFAAAALARGWGGRRNRWDFLFAAAHLRLPAAAPLCRDMPHARVSHHHIRSSRHMTAYSPPGGLSSR